MGLMASAPSFSQIPEPFVYFKQDFCDPAFPFQSATPNDAQVDHLIATSPATVTPGPCYLDAARTVSSGGGSVRIIRSTPLASPAPLTLHGFIELEVTDVTQEGTIAAYFGVGNNLPSNSTLIANSLLFSKLSIDFRSDGSYNLRISNPSGPATLSSPLSSRIKITWAMNNSSETTKYFSPLRTSVDLAAGQYDIWIDDEKWISGASRISNVPMDNFAFILSNGVGKVRIHHIEFSNNGFQLPLILTRFRTERRLNEAVVYWDMVEGHTAAQFVVERSTATAGFEMIGAVDVPDPSRVRFQFVDPSPRTGFNYYRLKMIGIDGEVKYSPIDRVLFDPSEGVMTLASNPAAPDRISLLATGVEPENISLHSMLGQNMHFTHQYNEQEMRLTLYPSTPLPSGIYLLKLRQGRPLKTFKVIIP